MERKDGRPNPHEDGAYALGRDAERHARMALRQGAHIASLTAWIDRMRVQTGKGLDIPYCDPLDGGVRARVLFLLEAPGGMAVRSGFISRDNPDPTARNFRSFLKEAGISRESSLIWNIVPWYLGIEKRIRPARDQDIQAGLQHLQDLLAQWPGLEAVVLVGRKALRAKDTVKRCSSATIFDTYHPSNRVVICFPEKGHQLRAKLLEVAGNLGLAPSGQA